MTYVQRNPNTWPATLPEVRDEDGRVWPTTEVPPGGEVTWPQRIAGFEGFPEHEPAPALPESDTPAEPAAAAEPDKHDATDTAVPVKTSAKSKGAAAAAAGGKEA
jgi:hypothetical protein